MNQQVDVIGIGAINYDYMFQCKRNPKDFKRLDRATDSSPEEFCSLEIVQESITDLFDNNYTDCSTQIGGSALLALRAVKIVCPELNIGYIGVYGEYNDFDTQRKRLIKKDLDEELSFIDNKEWLFRTKDFKELSECPEYYIGKSSCTIYKGDRSDIKIFPGANNILRSCIEEKNKEGSIVDYLAQAKWIHISSLADLDTWTYIMDFVLLAKERNRSLRISIDPGSKYTESYKIEIQKYLREADYVFLSPQEKEHLCGSRLNSEDKNNKALANYLGKKATVLVFKYKNRHVLLNCSKDTDNLYTYSHNLLPSFRIINDTGAGDYFAGGFIGALLSDKLIGIQPAPIEIGNIVSKSRMVVDNIHNVPEKAQHELEIYYSKTFKNGALNRKQKIMLYFDKVEKIALALIISLITGVLSTLIVEYIFGIF